jgi:iron(III) transport system ATP-binding protein
MNQQGQMSIRGLTKRYGNVEAVKGVSLELKDGVFSVLLGPSGCGKSTILRCIAGLERVTSGEIECGGLLFAGGRSHLPPEQRGLGMVFQSYAIWPHLSVFDNIAYPLKLRRVERGKIKEAVKSTAELLGLGALLDRNATRLSGGEQQRVALARALVYRPRVLLLDEPLSNLDAKIRREVRSELRNIQEKLGVTVIYVTHDQEEAMVLGDQVVVLKDGLVIQNGSPSEVYGRPQSRFVARFLGAANVLDIKGLVKEGDKVTVDTTGGVRISGIDVPEWDLSDAKYLCVRREEISISEGQKTMAGPGENLLQAEVGGTEYIGDRCELEVKVGEEKLRLYCPGGSRPGQQISISVPSRSVRLLKE